MVRRSDLERLATETMQLKEFLPKVFLYSASSYWATMLIQTHTTYAYSVHTHIVHTHTEDMNNIGDTLAYTDS